MSQQPMKYWVNDFNLLHWPFQRVDGMQYIPVYLAADVEAVEAENVQLRETVKAYEGGMMHDHLVAQLQKTKQLEHALAAKEAACAELSFALGVAYAACKENSVTISEDCERTVVAALNNECGKALLSQRDTLQAELAQAKYALDLAEHGQQPKHANFMRLNAELARVRVLVDNAQASLDENPWKDWSDGKVRAFLQGLRDIFQPSRGEQDE